MKYKHYDLSKTLNILLLANFAFIIITSLFTIIYLTDQVVKDKEKTITTLKVESASRLIEEHFLSMKKVLSDHASQAIIINPLMQFDKKNLPLQNYLSNLEIIGHKGSFTITSYDGALLYGDQKIENSITYKIINQEIDSFIQLEKANSNLFSFHVPILFRGETEGVLTFTTPLELNIAESDLKNYKLVISQSDKIFQVNPSLKMDIIESISTEILDNIKLEFSYDRSNFLNERLNTIFFIFSFLATFISLLILIASKVVKRKILLPHNKLMKLSEDLDLVNSQYKAILDSSKFMIIATDINGKITTFNKAAQETLQYSDKEVIGIHTPALIHKEEEVISKTEELNKKYNSNITPGFQTFIYENQYHHKSSDSEWTYVKKDGSEIPVRLIVTTIKYNDTIFGYLGIADDITEFQKTKELQQKHIEELKTTAKIKSQFLANMSHEIRTPLNGVIGLSEILESTKLDENQRDLVQSLKSSGRFLLSIINDVLDFSKIESGKMVLEKRSFSIPNLVNDLEKSFRPLFKDKDISFNINNNISFTNYIGDEQKLRQITTNLLSNAHKFTPNNGQVELRLFEVNHRFYVEIEDTGIGIPPNKLNTLFESFTQVDASTTREYGGTGLGLSISKSLTEMMDGKIEVSSRLNEGTVFKIDLPANFEDVKDTTELQEGQNLEIQSLNILVAEDNLLNQKVIKSLLQNLNQNITIVNNGQEALNILEANRDFDLILMDMQMPLMNGIECTKIIREKYGNTLKIVALTANAFQSDKEECLKAGMNDFLSKPISKNKLMGIIANTPKDSAQQVI